MKDRHFWLVQGICAMYRTGFPDEKFRFGKHNVMCDTKGRQIGRQRSFVSHQTKPMGKEKRRLDRPIGLSSLPLSLARVPSEARPGIGSLEGDGSAGALEGSLGLLRYVLGNLLQDHLRGAVNDVLGFLEAEARQGADLLDDLDLLVANGLQDDVELVLLLDLGSGSAGAAGSSNGNRGRSGDIEGVLEELHELGELDEGHFLERLDELVSAELCHGGSSFLVIRACAVSGVGGGSSSREPVASALVATRGDVFGVLDGL